MTGPINLADVPPRPEYDARSVIVIPSGMSNWTLYVTGAQKSIDDLAARSREIFDIEGAIAHLWVAVFRDGIGQPLAHWPGWTCRDMGRIHMSTTIPETRFTAFRTIPITGGNGTEELVLNRYIAAVAKVPLG